MAKTKEEEESLDDLEYLSDSYNFVKKTKSTKYVVSTFVLTMETIKLAALLVLLAIFQLKCSVSKSIKLMYSEIICRPLDTLPLAVPSFLYVLQDNLIIFALSCLDAATYQVGYIYLCKCILRQYSLNFVHSFQGNLSNKDSDNCVIRQNIAETRTAT